MLNHLLQSEAGPYESYSSLLSGKTPEEAFIAADEETGARKFARDEDDDEKEEEEFD